MATAAAILRRTCATLADYCGTSVDMIERHYAKWMRDDTPEELAALGGDVPKRLALAKAV